MKWASVKDRMPKKGVQVLLSAKDEPEYQGDNEFIIDTGYLDIYSPSGFNTMHDLTKYMDITHWMPIPNPPEEEL
jgi:hypothetical protein